MDLFNPATAAIDFFAYMGWAWDLKQVNKSLIEKKKALHGDNSIEYQINQPELAILRRLKEWIYGPLACFGPFFVFRWILMFLLKN